MNKGLKKFTKQITLAVGNAAETSININKQDANLHISVPLIATIGLNPIETSLTFNLQDKAINNEFGKGFKLNFYKKISGTTVYNYDGSSDSYTYGLENKETGLILKKVSDENYGAYHHEIEDKYGNKLVFNNSQNYPKTINYKNGNITYIDFVSETKIIKNGKGDEIKFKKNGNNNITLVEYYNENSLVNSVGISYDSNEVISKLIYKNGSTIVATTSFVFRDNEIVVIDDLSGYRIKYILDGNKVTSFIDGFDSNYTNGHDNKIEYFDNYSVLTNYKGDKSYSFFDDNNLLKFELDEDENVIETKYDNKTKKLKSNSGTINLNKINNLLKNNDLSTFDNEGLTLTKVSQSNAIFTKVIEGNVYKVSGTGTLKKTIKITGLATDNTLAILFAKQLTPTSENSYASVSLYAGDSYTDKFEKTKIDNLFSLMTLGVNAKCSYSEIELVITLHGNAEIEIGGIQITNKEFASFYQYDENGNASNLASGGRTTNISYGSSNLPSRTIGIDSTMYDYKYDDYGNLKEAITSYGVIIKNEYDSNNNLILNKVSNKEEDKILETKKTYTQDGRFITSETDELGNKTIYDEYDSFGKIKKVTNALGAISKFNYNVDGTLDNIILEKGATSSKANYKYDNKKRLSKVTLSNGSIYEFVYDAYNNVKDIKLNDTLVFSYEYDEKGGNLVKQKYGSNSDAYIFKYNNKNLIESIVYENNNLKYTKFNYFYNDYDELIRVEDSNGKSLTEYVYDEDGKIIEVKCDRGLIKNTYDNLGNICTKAIEVDSKKIYQSYDTVSRSKGSHPGAIYEPFSKLDAYIGMFEKDGNLTCQVSNTAIIPIINHKEVNKNLKTQIDGVIPCITVNSSNRLSYQLSELSYYNQPCGHISFWFKSDTTYSSSNKKYLFSVHTSYVGNHEIFGSNVLFKDFIGVYLLGKRIYLEVIDGKNQHYDLIKSDFDVDLSKWNFVSLNFMNRHDGQAYPDVCEYALVVNGHRQIFKKQDPRIYVDIDPDPVYNIGHKFDGFSCSSDFNGKITGLMIGRRTYFLDETVSKFYRLTNDYIIDNQLVDNDVKTVDFSQTNLFTLNQSLLDLFEIYPLQNNVTSLKGKKPVKFEIRNLSDLDKDRTFNFNQKIKKYAFVADGNELVYDFNIKNSGTIAMRAFADVSESKQYLFEGKDTNNNIIGLYRNSNNYLVVDVNGSKIESNLKFESNKWHSVSLSFKEVLTSSSNVTNSLDLRIVLDGESWVYNKNISFSYSNVIFIIGRKFELEKLPISFETSMTYCELQGQIEMLATRAAYCELDTINKLFEELKTISKVSEFDEFGMLKKVDIHRCGESILSNTYAYKTRDNDSKYISKQIKSEKIKFGAIIVNRAYETDALGNIIQINDTTFGSHRYEYDYRGFLVKADDETYSYDGNGNITRKGNKVLTYDSIIKDRLISFDGKTITYDSKNPLNPRRYKSNTYEFEGRRLTKYIYGGGFYKFIYNDQGLRIRKQDYRGVGTDYIYDGDKLITEISPDNRLDFLYDENGLLYGFIKDMSEKYLYIRDFMQNILGICNMNGNIVVKYKYDAWGQNLEVTGSDVSLGYLNPFRYKGYYYDTEIGMYYCKSRYYVPEWGRWLNADNMSSVQLSRFDINFYSYCNNNPIIGYDSNGHCPSWLSTVFKCVLAVSAVAITCVVAVATGGVTALVPVAIGATVSFGTTAIKDISDDGKFNSGWEEYVGATVSGAIGGLGVSFIGGVFSAGLADIVGGFIDGSVNSFETALGAFAGGAFFGAIGNKISSKISNTFALRKLNKIVPNWNAKNSKINKQLAKAGYKHLKIGRDGFEKVYEKFYKNEGYDALEKGIGYGLDFMFSLL